MSFFVRKGANPFAKALLPCLVGLSISLPLCAQGTSPSINGCPMFPADHVFNTRVDSLPVHPNSDAYVAELGAGPAHPDWGSDVPGGFPMNIVNGNSVPPATVNVNWPFTSDPGPYPIPSNAAIGATSDAHLIVLDVDNCLLYEAYDTFHNGDGSWTVDAISRFNLRSDALKPADWSSSNASGTAQLPLLVRYDEVAAGQINHAISMTGYPTGNSYVWPASHFASATSAAPPMGTRFRLKASYDISGLTPQAKVVAQALKLYGAILTDNGASWHLQGVPDTRFNDIDLHSLTQIPGSAFEAVDESSLEISPTSGQVASSTAGNSISINPSSGSGSTQTFTASFTSTNQSQEHFFFNSSLNGANSCYLVYDRPSNVLYIIEDQGTNPHQGVTPGGTGTLSNSQCSVPASSASVSVSGNTVSLTATINFLPSFAGPKNIYANISNTSYVEGSWQQIGTWTVTAPTGNSIIINPSSGSGSTQTFTASFTSTNQSQEHFFFNSSLNGTNSCYLVYDRPSNLLYIIEDQGTNPHQAITPGGSGTLSNSQCSVPASSASVSVAGNTVTVTATITFTPAFAGPKNIYANISNTSYIEGAWQQIGSWTVTAPTGNSITITPSSGIGLTQTFSASYTSTDQRQEHFFFNNSLNGTNSCYLVYDRVSNVLYIIEDQGTNPHQSVTPGGSGTLSNSQCSVPASSASVSVSGNTVTVTATITFAPSFIGLRNIYANITNTSGVEGTWQQIGTWTP